MESKDQIVRELKQLSDHMSQELNEITAIYQSLASLLKRIELLYKRVSKLEQESKEKDELIERLNKENDYLMKENIDVIINPNRCLSTEESQND